MERFKMKMPKMLTVAGSDSGGGAGIQADVRTGTLLGCHVSTAITAVTAQNSMGVQGVTPLPARAVAEQMRSILSDIGAAAAKTGMLFDGEVIEAVASEFVARPGIILVVDPVMVAKGGAKLLLPEAQRALTGKLLPLAHLVTPNIPEAEALSGIKITDLDSSREACRRIIALGPRAVLLKGGHGEGKLIHDLLLTAEGRETLFTSERIDTPHTHGTGCTLSAAITANLAKGMYLSAAVAEGRAFLLRAIARAYPTGSGHGSTNPVAAMGRGAGAVIERLHQGWEILEEANPFGLIPEVQSNLAEMLENPVSFQDIAAFPGRIVRSGSRIRRVDGPRFGASRHMAKILLAGARRKSPFKAVMNVRYGEDVLAAIGKCGFSVDGFSRKEEPVEVKAAEGSTLEWGTGRVIDRLGYAPEAIFDEGDEGKEPMIRVFGVDAVDVARKVARIWAVMSDSKGEGNIK